MLSLTDHDTVSGVSEAINAGNGLGMIVIPGIELSAAEHPNLHILGYCIDISNPKLIHLCKEAQMERERHTLYIKNYLSKHGIPINLDEVREVADGGAIGRPHFAQVLVRHGYVKSSREAFDKYLDTDDYHKIPRKKPSARCCIETIKTAGGFPVLAHPYQLLLDDVALETELNELLSYGLAGIECFYPKHSTKQQSFYLHLAAKYHIHTTAGSDFHGEKVHREDKVVSVELNDISWLLSNLKSL